MLDIVVFFMLMCLYCADVYIHVYLFLLLFTPEENRNMKKEEKIQMLITIGKKNQVVENEITNSELISDHLPLDAPGGASYMKFRPFLTRSSPINNLEIKKQPIESHNIQNLAINIYTT